MVASSGSAMAASSAKSSSLVSIAQPARPKSAREAGKTNTVENLLSEFISTNSFPRSVLSKAPSRRARRPGSPFVQHLDLRIFLRLTRGDVHSPA